MRPSVGAIIHLNHDDARKVARSIEKQQTQLKTNRIELPYRSYADLRKVRPQGRRSQLDFPAMLKVQQYADCIAHSVLKSISGEENAASAATKIAGALPTNPSQAAPRPSTNISAARSTANTPDTDCARQSAELPGLSSPFRYPRVCEFVACHVGCRACFNLRAFPPDQP